MEMTGHALKKIRHCERSEAIQLRGVGRARESLAAWTRGSWIATALRASR
jgi:hypothetical protein